MYIRMYFNKFVQEELIGIMHTYTYGFKQGPKIIEIGLLYRIRYDAIDGNEMERRQYRFASLIAGKLCSIER